METTVTLKVDSNIFKQAEEKLNSAGSNINTAFTDFLEKYINIPKKKPPNKFMSMYGAYKDKMWVADDWNEPLEDFEGY